MAREITARDAWSGLIRDQLEANDPIAFHQAAEAARKAGIDPFEWHWRRLQERPTDSGAWNLVMQHVNTDRIDAALSLADRHLPLNEISTGPADEIGFGPQFELHSCLDAILQSLKAYPGKGSRLLAAGLLSPVVRNRYMAINALEAWNSAHWGDDIREALVSARQLEIDEDLSKRLNMLSG